MNARAGRATSKVLITVLLVTVAVLGLGGPATATDDGSATVPTATAPSTSPPETAPGQTAPENSLPENPAPDTTLPAQGSLPGTDDGTTTTDPLINELPGEDAPETDASVPEPDSAYNGQAEYEPAAVLWSSVRTAERKVSAAEQAHRESIARVREARLVQKKLRLRKRALDADGQQASSDIAASERRLRERAVAAFVTEDSQREAVLSSLEAVDHDRLMEFRIRTRLLAVALDADDQAIADYLELRSSLEGDALVIVDALRAIEKQTKQRESEVEVVAAEVAQAEDELEAFRAGSAIYIDDVVFPVAPPDLPLIDSFGFPRMPGTPDEHWHEGIDIFAPAGTPLVAAERGVITKVGSSRLGGLSVWLRGESGADWYYAHLQSHAPGMVAGLVVEAGDLLGYVGNTGNAATTPAHLHLELHPGGRADGNGPVNPYPLLKVVSDRDQARAAAGG